MQSVVIITDAERHKCKKCCQCPHMKCVCYSRYVKKCKFLSENLRNVLAYPWLGNFSFSQNLLFFTLKNVGKSYCFMRECPDSNAFIFFVESWLLNVLSSYGCQGMFLSMCRTSIKSSLEPHWQLWHLLA